MAEMEERIADLERRLALIEGIISQGDNEATTNKNPALDRAAPLINVNISKKKYSPANPDMGEYEDHIWFNVTYSAGTLNKPTRALKGVLCFSDIFGEIKFRVNVTVNDRIDPGRPFTQEGIGFTYNQFMQEHQWMLVTQESDMKFSFIVKNVIYIDGSSEEF
ncbi:hypothetical protein ACWYXK_07735 [Janthinobacterium lividum]|uniref:hypothetical protein n=1 Tax=Janthinobacterium sp. BJB446 TaxID=2048009 RepID=UPI001179EA0E|nr:hypothetical protein [Janthinobacterium sp. BJB446]